MNSKVFDYIVLVIVFIGAINWGLIAFFRFDLVAWLLGDMTMLSRIVYGIVGLCGLYLLCMFGRIRAIGEEA